MQNLDVISINIWQILISLCNLVLLFIILKKFLYQPVVRVLQKRQKEIDNRYAAAEKAKMYAENDRGEWEQKLQTADEVTQNMIKKAEEQANMHRDKIVKEARERADSIMNEAHSQARAEYRTAQESIKKEIADVSAVMAEKLLGREISIDDHREIIDSVLSEMENGNEENQ